MLNLNHAAGDGVGALQVLQRIAREYAGGDGAAPLEFLAASELPVRPASAFGPGLGDAAELWFSTPARSPLSLSVGAITVAGRLHVTVRYPRRVLSADAARRFSECYIDHARRVAGVA